MEEILEKDIPSPIGSNTELCHYYCGREICSPGHSWGPGLRDHFLIHYVVKGQGKFLANNRKYQLGSGDGFLICPQSVSYYCADSDDPWSYLWVGFHGTLAEHYLNRAGLSLTQPIFHYAQQEVLVHYLSQMIASTEMSQGRDVRLSGMLHLFLSDIIESFGTGTWPEGGRTETERYVDQAVEFVHMNYSRRIRIAEIARYLGLDRKYLCAIFKRRMSLSPQEYLINYRIRKACELMANRSLAIGDVARSVGYVDPLQFSRVFHKSLGLSPRSYRQGLWEGNL